MVLIGIPVIVLLGYALLSALFSVLIVTPWVDEQFGNHHRPWWQKAAMWVGTTIIGGLAKRLIHRLSAEASRVFVNNEPALGRWVNRLAVNLEKMSGTIAAMSLETYQALVYVRRTLVPTLIARAIAPLQAAIKVLQTDVRVIQGQLTTARKYVNSVLNDLPWGTGSTFELALRQFAGAFEHLWDQYYNFQRTAWQPFISVKWPALLAQFTQVWHWFTGTAKDTLSDIVRRLEKLEKGFASVMTDPTNWVLTALGLSLIPAVSAARMRTKLQAATCNETEDFNSSLCNSAAGTGRALGSMLPLLLAFAVDFAILLDAREVAKAAEEATTTLRDMPVTHTDAIRHWAGL